MPKGTGTHSIKGSQTVEDFDLLAEDVEQFQPVGGSAAAELLNVLPRTFHQWETDARGLSKKKGPNPGRLVRGVEFPMPKQQRGQGLGSNSGGDLYDVADLRRWALEVQVLES